jgi:hypothetical protein
MGYGLPTRLAAGAPQVERASAKVGSSEIGPFPLDIGKSGLFEVRSAKVGSRHPGACEVRAFQIGILKARAVQFDSFQVALLQQSVPEARAAEIRLI